MKLLHLALLSLLLCPPARAQEIEYGEGVVCYTQQQAEQLAAHFDEGAGAALSAVNAGEHDHNACNIVTVAFVRGRELATVRSKATTFQIVRILVVGVAAPTGFQSVVPVAFVSLFRVEERAV